MSRTRVEFPQSRVRAGVARVDITPPVGIYHRMWGAATHDQATGIHQPLTATIVSMACEDGSADEAPVVFVGIDHCLFWFQEMQDLLNRITEETQIPADHIRCLFSHTHAAGLMGYERVELPGGELIPDYLKQVAAQISAGIALALEQQQTATIVYGSGHCSLAANRDYWDDAGKSYVCGFNPEGQADPTVVVARIVSDSDQQTLASVVNYACHPTTLAWDNTLISPDYVGTMRETIESQTGAPCLFIQGASGDIGPRDGFVGDLEVAERNGRQLGYAALEALEGLPPALHDFQYSGPVVSGATIGTWKWVPITDERRARLGRFQLQQSDVELEYQSGLQTREQLLEEDRTWEAAEAAAGDSGDATQAREARAMRERVRRRLTRVGHLQLDKPHAYPIWLWRCGEAIWVALDGEHYNVLQRTLRERFPDCPLIIGTLANGSRSWYLPDQDSYGKGLYQESASVLARGSLEQLTDELTTRITELLERKTR